VTGPFTAGDELTADVLNDAWLLAPRGIMAAPVSTTANGTPTAADTVEVKDTTLADYVFTAETGRRYRVHYHGVQANSATADSRMVIRVRDGGVAAPTSASTLIGETKAYVRETAGGGRVTADLVRTFTASSGVHTLAAFTQSPDAVIMTPVEDRELYVEDIGPV
jgi:hypothetical protein